MASGSVDRMRCCVPGCPRSRGQRKSEGPIRSDEEWICGEHWRAVPGFLRKRKTRIIRRYRKLYGDNSPWSYPGGSPNRLGSWKLAKMSAAIWRICKRAAIERALGIR